MGMDVKYNKDTNIIFIPEEQLSNCQTIRLQIFSLKALKPTTATCMPSCIHNALSNLESENKIIIGILFKLETKIYSDIP